MNKYSKYRPKSKEVKILSVQDCTYRKTEREEFRIASNLKDLVKNECEIKNMSRTEFYTKLAMWYFSKIGKVEEIEKKKLIHGKDWVLE